MQSDDLGLVARLRDHEGLGAALAHDRGQTGRYISAVMDEAAAAIERLVAERDEAREALKPFAKAHDQIAPYMGNVMDEMWTGGLTSTYCKFTIGDFRRARQALGKTP